VNKEFYRNLVFVIGVWYVSIVGISSFRGTQEELQDRIFNGNINRHTRGRFLEKLDGKQISALTIDDDLILRFLRAGDDLVLELFSGEEGDPDFVKVTSRVNIETGKVGNKPHNSY
jgi:hypothetical protein